MVGSANFLVTAVLWVSTIQISTFLHELGHCLPVLAFTKNKAVVILGHGRTKVSFIIRRLHVHLRGFAPWIGFMTVGEDVVLTKPLSLLSSLGGPMISLVIGTSAFLFRLHADGVVLYSVLSVVGLYNWCLFLCTAMPIVYPEWWLGYGGRPSDGYRVFRLITGKGSTLQ